MRFPLIIIYGLVLKMCLSDSDFGKSEFVDVFTNHQNEQEVEDSFYEIHHIPKVPKFVTKRKDNFNFQFFNSEDDFIESEYGKFQTPKKYFEPIPASSVLDRNNYIYPNHPHFYTQTYPQPDDSNKNYILIQSQQVIPDSENYGSFYMSPEHFETNKSPQENVEIVTIPYNYVQKIPSPTTGTSSLEPITQKDFNKYEEIDLIPKNNHTIEQKPKNIKKQINNMIKRYLAKFIVEKYGLNKENKTDNKNSRKYSFNRQNLTATSKNNLKTDPESKFIYTNALWDLKNKTITKIKQLFSIFTVVKFNNTECNVTNWAGTWQGVCLTSAECTQSNGTALGTCASGYGVCCVFRGSCGDSSSRNCSYFKSPNYPDYYPSNGGVISPTTTVAPTLFPTPDPRLYWYYFKKDSGNDSLDDLMMGRQSTSDTTSCIFRVYKTNSNVQQFRIDFIDLDLASPTNGTCTNERFIITGQNTNDRVPVFCGYNTGQHVYVDVSQLTGPLQLMVLSTTGARKRFKLKICQYTDTCSSSQSNCLQYYTGVSGVIQSFNYDQAAMFNRSTPGYFNNLNYAICIRREAGYCSITYTNVQGSQTYPFQLINVLPSGQSTIPPGQAGVDILNCPDDYIIIDGTRLCGDRLNDGSTTANFSLNAEVTDISTGPIVINVRTNSAVTGLGFKIYYTQNACSTT